MEVDESSLELKSSQLFVSVFVIDDERNRILLGLNKTGLNAGKYDGFGGKVKAGETIENAAIRGLNSESGLFIKSQFQRHFSTPDVFKLTNVGTNIYDFADHPVLFEVHLFAINYSKLQGRIAESIEKRPEWFNYNEIPFHQMWSDHIFWFHSLLKRNVTINGYYLFESLITDVILRKELRDVPHLTLGV